MRKLKNPDVLTKLVALALLAGLCLLVEILIPGFYAKVAQLTTSKEALIRYLQSFGHWAILVSFLLDVLINAVGFLPSVFVSTANGLVFGMPLGILVSWLAETVGVIISFLIMRFFFRDWALMIIEKSEKLQYLDQASGKNGLWWMMFARAMPYFPSGVLTAVGAVSGLSFWDYCLANLIGKFPSTALEVVIGHDLVNLQEHYKRLALWLVLAVVLFLVVRFMMKRKDK